jgi:alkanesulfonate monooxygenase SsuD/methylene tetrahydromethanopterin reductase-like flavin-dependent oxidoreductase (luciferase family)
VARFAEFVELVDLLLRQEFTDYDGRFYKCAGAETLPLPVRPRPPLTVAAHGPKMLRIAARFADGWSSWGGYGVDAEEDFYRVTAERSRRFDDLCTEMDRDPTSIRLSVVCFPPLVPWESVDYFTDLVGRMRTIGIDEFVLYWPQAWRQDPRERAAFDEITSAVIPSMRAAEDPARLNP